MQSARFVVADHLCVGPGAISINSGVSERSDGRQSGEKILMAYNVYVCAVAGIGGQMKEVRLICPTTPKLSRMSKRCLKTKLQIYVAPRNGTYIVL
jgi:hypothetical protein